MSSQVVKLVTLTYVTTEPLHEVVHRVVAALAMHADAAFELDRISAHTYLEVDDEEDGVG